MNTATPIPLEAVNGEPLSDSQRVYLHGYFSGLAARGVRFSDVEPPPQSPTRGPSAAKVPALDDLIFEERVKREGPPLESYQDLIDNAVHNAAPDKEETFRFKWHGLFYLSPVKEAFMARLRIPGGRLKSHQLRELADVARELTTGYLQITTRANLQMRLIEPKDCPEFLRRVQSVGLHTRGSGADNIRNLTCNPTAGIDPHELIDTLPLCQELGQIILNDRSFYDLPRKFNVAFDGGGLIGSVEDTNDIGARAVRVGDEILFRMALGGATGHKAFARDLGVLVPPADLNRIITATIRVYMAHGNRGDRKKARLKHLLDVWSLDRYRDEIETLLGCQLRRSPPEDDEPLRTSQGIPHSHLGVYAQKQAGLNYVGAAVPVGQITSRQLTRLAEVADLYGSSEIRLTVWQNFIIPNVPDAFVATVNKALRRLGFETSQSLLRGGFVACTGNTFCKYAQVNTKDNALAIANHLDKRVALDAPINIHITGCPNSCAQHYIGDIGLLGVKVRGEEAFHVFVGGGFGGNRAVGRQVFAGIAVSDLNLMLEKMLKAYLRRRNPGEGFQHFSNRHDLNTLQAIFSNDE